jgi:hypothetical protein
MGLRLFCLQRSRGKCYMHVLWHRRNRARCSSWAHKLDQSAVRVGLSHLTKVRQKHTCIVSNRTSLIYVYANLKKTKIIRNIVLNTNHYVSWNFKNIVVKLFEFFEIRWKRITPTSWNVSHIFKIYWLKINE